MINELLEYMSNDADAHKLASDNHSLSDGYYVKINMDGVVEQISFNAKKDDSSNMDWFRERDMLSCFLNANKAINASKAIHSTNYMTVFFKPKADKFYDKKLKVFKEDTPMNYIEPYFESLKMRFGDQEDFLSDESLETYKNKFIEVITELNQSLREEVKDNTYLKVFFDLPIEDYKREASRYFKQSLFSNNNYNIMVGDTLYGVSDFNNGLNVDKPYLKHLTTPFVISEYISYEKAEKIYYLSEWLKQLTDISNGLKLCGRGYIEMENTGQTVFDKTFSENKSVYKIKCSKGKTGIIMEEFYPIAKLPDNDRAFEVLDYVKADKYKPKYKKIYKYGEILSFLDKYLFNEELWPNFYKDLGKIETQTSIMKYILIAYRDHLKEYFYHKNTMPLKHGFNKFKALILQDAFQKMCISGDKNAFSDFVYKLNIVLSLEKYIQGDEKIMKVQEVSEKLNEKLNKKDEIVEIETEEEFYFACGQLIYYLSSLSQAQNKTQSLYRYCTRANTSVQLKQAIQALLKQYAYLLKINHKKLNNLISMINGYDIMNTVRTDILYVGLTINNLLYKKENEENEQIEE